LLEKKSLGVVSALLAHNAPIHLPDNKGQLPIEVALATLQ